MSSEWPTVRLGDYVDACLGKMLDVKKNKGIPQVYLGNSNVRWGRFDLENLAEMKFESHEEERYSLVPGDLVVCEGGEPGRCAIWNGPAGMKIQKALHRIRPKKDLNNYYIFYWFNYAAGSGKLEPFFTGTTIKHLTGKAISELLIPLPPLPQQLSMVGILKKLDDRITLLRETNATLEAIAQALFKSWFVDFDPVHANARARAQHQNSHSQAAQQNPAPQPAEANAQNLGLDAATAALFPDHFQDSDLGPIPAGWECKMLGDICSYISRGISPKYVEDDGVLVINQKCIRDFAVDTDKARRHDSMARKITGREIQVGDVLVNSTGVGTLGRLAQVLEVQETMIVDSHVTVVRTNNDVPWTYLGQWMIKHQPIIEDMGEGSTGQTELSRSKLADLMILVPSSAVLKEFDKKVIGLKNKVSLNNQKAKTLTQLRDTLLPRLISGQLRLPDAEAQIEELVGGA